MPKIMGWEMGIDPTAKRNLKSFERTGSTFKHR